MGEGGDNFVTFGVEVLVALEDVWVLVVVDPFVGAYGDIAGGVEFVVLFDDVDILDAEAVAGAEHGAGVVALEDVFENYGDMTGSVEHEAFDESAAVVADELCKDVVELLFLFVVVGSQKTLQFRSDVWHRGWRI